MDGDFVGSSDRGDSDGTQKIIPFHSSMQSLHLDGDSVGSVVNGEFDGVMLGREVVAQSCNLCGHGEKGNVLVGKGEGAFVGSIMHLQEIKNERVDIKKFSCT